jgi:hypothetical protein
MISGLTEIAPFAKVCFTTTFYEQVEAFASFALRNLHPRPPLLDHFCFAAWSAVQKEGVLKRRGSAELIQEPEIVLQEVPQVVYPVRQHRNPLNA